MKKIIYFLLIAAVTVTACQPGEVGLSPAEIAGPKAWFDAPLPNSAYPMGPVQIIAHGSDPAGIASFELSVNGQVWEQIPSPDKQSSLVTLTHSWNPPQPGTYTLGLSTMNNKGEFSADATTLVVITGDETPTAEPTPLETETPEPTAAPSPTMTIEAALVEILRISGDTVYYRGTTCGPQEVTILVRANHPDGVKVVVLFYRLSSKSGGGSTDYLSEAMNPLGNDQYELKINPVTKFGGGVVSTLGESWLQYQAVVQTNSGDTSTRTTLLSDITVRSCP